MNITNKKDALGNTIIFGNRYGYSNDSSGVTTVNSGEAYKETPSGMISLRVDHSVSASSVGGERRPNRPKNVSVKPIKLFPLASDD